MRNPISLALLLAVASAAVAQRTDPTILPPPAVVPDRIVIEPKRPDGPRTVVAPAQPGTVSVLKGTDPLRPGFLVISPNPAAASTLLPPPAAASRVENRNGVPHVVIVGSDRRPTMPDEPPTNPVAGAKPNPPQPQPQPEKVADGRILLETYDTAYCRGCKVGYLHTLVREYERNGKKVLYGSKRLTLQIARFGQAVEQWTEETTVEAPDGTIYSTAMRQGLGKNQMLSLTGRVTDAGLEVTIEGAAGGKEVVKWPENVTGVAKEATLLQDHKPKPGLGLTYKVYFGQFNAVVSYTMTAKGVEEVEVNGQPRKLMKVVQEMTPIGDFRQPPVAYYVDPETYEPVKLESDMPAFGGVLTAVRTSREVALARPTKYLDLADAQSIKLAGTVPGIHQKDSVTYRVTLGGELPPDRAFPTDARQKVTALDPQTRTLDLTVTAVRTPPNDPTAAPPGKEYLADCFYIDWDNELVRKHAAAAVARLPQGASAWDKARAVETWVNQNMKQVEFSQAMGTCKNTAQELSGDCTEHAMLAAGMCRALGIPSRTAIGLVYAPARDGTATLAYHMWYEVWAGGGWVALDAIMGLGSVGPGHVKIADAHWDGERGFTPLLPVLNLLGTRPKVEVVK